MLTLLAQGIWRPAQVIATTVPSSRPTIPEIETVIAQSWQQQVVRLGAALFDGPLVRLESFQTDGGDLLLNLSTTNYRTFLGTNLFHADLAGRFGRPALANAIGLSAALLTSDGQLVMGRRNDRVAYYPNRVHPFAGALEPDDVPNIFDGVRRELTEELNLPSADVHDLQMVGIIEDQRLLQPEFIFAARTTRTSAQLRQSLNLSEHRELWQCAVALGAFRELFDNMERAGDFYTPIAVGTLLFVGRLAFGAAWSDRYFVRFFPGL